MEKLPRLVCHKSFALSQTLKALVSADYDTERTIAMFILLDSLLFDRLLNTLA